MENKQIIIDSIDVAGCEYLGLYKECKLKCGSCCPVDCSDNPNCYYKQLKRKEQECEELKEDRERWKSNFNGKVSAIEELLQQLDQLKEENDELKEIIQRHDNDNNALLKEVEEELYEYYRRDRECLNEIKDIAEPYKMTIKKICGNCKKYDDCHACCYKDINCYKYTSSKTNACEEFTYLDEFVPNILANNILQKISEVIK